MKRSFSFAMAHAAVLASMLGVFLVDGCVNRKDRHDTRRPADASPMVPASTHLDLQRAAPSSRRSSS